MTVNQGEVPASDPPKQTVWSACRPIVMGVGLGVLFLVFLLWMMLYLRCAPQWFRTMHQAFAVAQDASFLHTMRSADYPQGMTVEQVREQSSSLSQEMTRRYGGNDTVFVLSSDPKLKFFLANYRNRETETFGYQYPGDGTELMKKNPFLPLSLFRRALGLDPEVWNQYITYLHLSHKQLSASAATTADDGGKRVVYIRPESDQRMFEARYVEGAPPYEFELEEFNHWAYFHEFAHAQDRDVLVRLYVRDDRLLGVKLTREEADLVSESIADLYVALVMLRQTQNNDTYDYLIRPFRTSSVDDLIHATHLLIDEPYRGFSFEQVKGKSDPQLLDVAILTVSAAVRSHMDTVRDDMSVFTRRAIRFDELATRCGKRLGTGCPAFKAEASIADQREDGRRALADAIRNLVYQGKLEQKSDVLRRAIRAHAEGFGDYEVRDALAVASAGDHFDTVLFSREMGFSIDWSAHGRRAENVRLMKQYFDQAMPH
ncbi:hypothetical protein HZF02_13640 [Pseudomonas yamanorum]|nr:hypothetical protein HZF02_13640 [Pseudomonas yamanorum]